MLMKGYVVFTNMCGAGAASASPPDIFLDRGCQPPHP
jgi:hypothetical protein